MSSGDYGAASGGNVWDGDDGLECVVGDDVDNDGGGLWLTVVVVVVDEEEGVSTLSPFTVGRGWQESW